MNIFGDIAGNYKTFQALLNKMPQDDVIVVGDFIDRGPNSKDMVEWLRLNGKALLGNHEHMCLDAYLYSQDTTKKPYYSPELWLNENGGLETLRSYKADFDPKNDKICEVIPDTHIEFLKKLPLFIETDDLLISHAPLKSRSSPEKAAELGQGFYKNLRTSKEDFSFIWNRQPPRFYKDKLQIFGHMGFLEPRYYSASYTSGSRVKPKDKLFAIGIDTSCSRILTALHYPSMVIYQQSYID